MFRVQNIIHHTTSDETLRDMLTSKRIVVPSSLIGTTDRPYYIYHISAVNKYRMKYTTMVYEFSAPEGIVYMNETLMDELCIGEGNVIRLKEVNDLPKGRLIKIRPNHSDFTRLDDPKGFLERGIVKSYPVINNGERIRIGEFYFDVVDTEPAETITTIDTDLSVDFLEPCDMINLGIK